MSALFNIVPAPYRWLILAALLAVFGAFCALKAAEHQETKDAARDAKQVQQQLQAQIAATTHTLAEEHRKTDAVQGVANEIRKQLDTARVAADSNHAAGERLRDQLATAYAACSGTAKPAAAAGSAPTSPAASVLADVQRRLADAEDATGRFADQSRIAGLGCERAYDALTPPSTPKE